MLCPLRPKHGVCSRKGISNQYDKLAASVLFLRLVIRFLDGGRYKLQLSFFYFVRSSEGVIV